MPKVLLLLPSNTYRAPDFIDAAKKLGVEVVVGTDHDTAIESHGVLTLDLMDEPDSVARIIEYAERSKLDGIVAVDDTGVKLAALAAEALGLPSGSSAAVALTRNKLELRRALEGTAIPQPDFAPVSDGEDAGAVCTRIGFPCVLKPLSLAASRGVIRVDDAAEARVAADRIGSILAAAAEPDTTLIAERFVEGPEVALEGMYYRGELHVLAIFDKPDPLDGPYFEETLYVTPSRLPERVSAEISSAVVGAASAIGLQEGPIHAELRNVTTEPVLIDVAARTIGGLCSRALRFGVGVTLEELVLRHAVGLPMRPMRRERAASGVAMLPIERSGRLRAVTGVEEARTITSVAGVEITIPIGEAVTPLPEGDRYLGFVFAVAATPAEVEAALRSAIEVIQPEIS